MNRTYWSQMTPQQQDKVRDTYEIPEDTTKVFVNELGQAFELYGNDGQIGLTLKSTFDSFHNYSNKQ